MSTWPEGITPAVHYSESKEGSKPQAHSDYIKRIPETYGNVVDIMVEAKQKDLSILKFI
jgi:UV DNA damage endonuclease